MKSIRFASVVVLVIFGIEMTVPAPFVDGGNLTDPKKNYQVSLDDDTTISSRTWLRFSKKEGHTRSHQRFQHTSTND